MSSYWLTDPELFLYAKGTGPDDVHLWRCKNPVSTTSSSLVVPMKPDDFEYVETVKNHLELIANMFTWDEPDYKRLVKYIYEKCILVNSQGFVIAELLHKAEKDGNKTTNDANKEEEEEVPAIYIRSLDVLPLKPYIPKLTERPIPLRTVKYLGDVNGKAAPMEEDSKGTKLTARVDSLEAENIRLESMNNTLNTNVTKLTARVANLEAENTRQESKNNTLDTNVTKLTADMIRQINAFATLQQEVKNIANKEVWMNDLTNSAWVGFEGLGCDPTTYDKLDIREQPGTIIRDDNSTNVQARYQYKLRVYGKGSSADVHAICLEDLIPNKEKARFSPNVWGYFKSQGNPIYLYRQPL